MDKKALVIKPKVVVKKAAPKPSPVPKASLKIANVEMSDSGIAAQAIASNGLDVPDNLI